MLNEQTDKLNTGRKKSLQSIYLNKILVSKIYTKKLLKLSNKKSSIFKNGQKAEPHQDI